MGYPIREQHVSYIYTHNKELIRAISVSSPPHWSGSTNELIATLMLKSEEWIG